MRGMKTVFADSSEMPRGSMANVTINSGALPTARRSLSCGPKTSVTLSRTTSISRKPDSLRYCVNKRCAVVRRSPLAASR
jgi:hypothetical protein